MSVVPLDMAKIDAKQAAKLRGSLTVGDLAAWDALPDDVRELAQRILGPNGAVGADAVAAYEEGFADGAEEAMEEMRYNTVRCPGPDEIRRRLASA